MAIILIDGEPALLLSHVPSEFRRRNVPLSHIHSHRKLREMCTNGTLVPPCELHNDRFWIIRISRLPDLASLLGLTLDELAQTTALPTAPECVGAAVHRRVDTPRKAA